MDLASASSVLRLLADPTRVRLLALLENEELTVAELAAVLHLAQPRVSTHLAKLKEAGLVRDRRAGVSAYYRANSEGEEAQHKLLDSLRQSIDDALLREDTARLPGVLAQRAGSEGWADTGAGDMERHYSPGRTWETLARSLLQLLETGDVLDIASGDGITAELLAPHAKSITCVDSSERVVDAAAKRLRAFPHVQVLPGDMQALDLGERRFDLVLMLHALTYAENPAMAVAEASRVLRPGGRLLAVTLGQRNLGFSSDQLRDFASRAELDVISCHQISRERKAPHFEVISLLARKPH
jgi:DNA-binding transcriptional ArsR family regulator/protein-L-isoaspartate O-methyltransferase